MKIVSTLLPVTLLLTLGASAPALAQQAVRPKIQVALGESKSFAFSPSRPRLVVLMHGVTNPPANALEEGIATAKHARWYWGFDFIRSIMGEPTDPVLQLIQHRRNRTSVAGVSGESWSIAPKGSATTLSALKTEGDDLAPVLLPTSVPTSGNGTIAAAGFKAQSDPHTAVMVTFRDGSQHLLTQTGAAIEQIYDTYQKTFGHLPEGSQPQIYLVTHSFGGIVARAILTNPEGADLYGGRLTIEQRKQADFLRRRVVLVGAMSAPHTGTIIPELTGDVDRILKTGKSILPRLETIKGSRFLSTITPDILEEFLGWVHGKLDGVIKSASGNRDSLHDILRMAEYNKGILSPEKATRTDGSYVPIYTLGGRNPGGKFLDRKRAPFVAGGRILPHSMIDLLKGERFASDAAALYLIESLLHRAGYGKADGKPWGAAAIPEADMMASPMRGVTSNLKGLPLPGNFTATSLVPMTAGVLYDGLTANPYAPGADGENDTDGFCAFDSYSGLGVMGGTGKPWWWKGLYGARYGSLMPWDQDNHGSEMFNVGNGLYLYNELVRNAGPIPVLGSDLGIWKPSTDNNLARHNVKVEFTRVWSRDGEIDSGTNKMKKGDFTVYVRVAGNLKTFVCKEDADPTKNAGSHGVSNTPQSVIPIVFSVIDRDDLSPDDDCALSPEKGRDNVYVYYDTRTGRIFGDATGKAGEEITVGGYKGVYNPVGIGFKVTGN